MTTQRLLYEGDAITQVLSWREGATAYHLERGPSGINEHRLEPTVIGSLSPKPVRQSICLDVESKRACVGRYQLMSRLMEVVVTIEGGQLFAQYGAQPKAEIFPESESHFFLRVADAQVSFERDSDGTVSSLVHHQNGRATYGFKVKAEVGK